MKPGCLIQSEILYPQIIDSYKSELQKSSTIYFIHKKDLFNTGVARKEHLFQKSLRCRPRLDTKLMNK